MSKLRVVETVQKALAELAAENTYINEVSCPVAKWSTSSSTGEPIKVLCQAVQSRRIAPDMDFYEVTSSYHVLSYISEDEDREKCNAIFEELSATITDDGIVAALNSTAIIADTNVTVNGVVVDTTTDGVQENDWLMSITFRVFVTATPST